MAVLIRGIAAKLMFKSMAEGFGATFPKNKTIIVDGVEYTGAQLEKLFLQASKACVDADNAHKAARAAVKKRNEALGPPTRLTQEAIKALVQFYGGDSIKLAQFGIPEVKSARDRTLEEKLAAAKKGLATRKLRGTKGKRELAKIKAEGDFVVTVSDGSSDTRDAATATPEPQPVSATAPVQPAPTPIPVPSTPVSADAPAPAAVNAGDGTSSSGSNGAGAMLVNGSGH